MIQEREREREGEDGGREIAGSGDVTLTPVSSMEQKVID